VLSGGNVPRGKAMGFNVHFAERSIPPRFLPGSGALSYFIAGLLGVLAALLIDAALTGGTNVRAFHKSASALLHRA
jgi:hypothetical protein